MKKILNFVVVIFLAFCSGMMTVVHAAQNYSGVWWEPIKNNGMGLFCFQQTEVTVGGVSSEVIFCSWFHYTPSNQSTFMVFSGTLTKDSLGRDVIAASLIRPKGTPPLGYDASQLTYTVPGNVKMTFNNASSATFEYSFDGQAGVLNMIPEVFASDKRVMSYTDKVYTLYVGGYPYAVTKTGVTKVVNKTSFTTGFFPLFNCALYEVPIETGIIPLQCTVASDNIRRMFYINPLTEELFQYTGSFAFDSTKLHDVGFGTATPYGINVGHSGEYAEVADGIYWGPVRSDQKLRFSPKVANGYDFNTVTIIATGTGPDFFKFLFKYSF